MSKPPPTDLFRKEAIRHRTRALFGDVILAAPLSTWLITGLLMAIMAGVVAFGMFGNVTTINHKYGGSYYNPLVPLRLQQEMAFVRSQIGDNTYYFQVPENIANSYSVGDTTSLFGRDLNGRGTGPFPAEVKRVQKIEPHSWSNEYPSTHLLVLRELPMETIVLREFPIEAISISYPYATYGEGPFLIEEHNSTPIWRWALRLEKGPKL